MFGNAAKGIDIKDGDVDIAVLKLNSKDAFVLFEAREFLGKTLGKAVDLGTFNSMKIFIENRIKKDFIYV